MIAHRLRRSPFLLNFFSMGGASILVNLIGLIALGYPARVLGPEKYGLTVFGASVAAYVGIVLSPGLLTWGTRAISQDRDHAGRILVLINLTQLALACFGYLVLVICSTIFWVGEQRDIVLLYGLGLFVTALNVDWVYFGLELARIPAWFSVLSTMLTTIGLFTLIRLPIQVYRLPLLLVAVLFIVQMTQSVVLVRRFKVRLHLPSAESFRISLRASVPLGIYSILTTLNTYANNFIVNAYLGLAAVGMYSASSRLIDLSVAVMPILSVVFLTRLSRMVAQDLDAALRESLLFLRTVMTISFWTATLMFAESFDVIQIVYGTRYAEAQIPLQIMCLVTILGPATACYTGSLIPFRKDWIMVFVVVTVAIASFTAGPLLVARFGLIGAAWARVGMNLVGLLISLPTYRSLIGTIGLSSLQMPILGAGSMLAVFLVLKSTGIPVWARLPIEALVYLPFGLKNLAPVFAMLKGRQVSAQALDA